MAPWWLRLRRAHAPDPAALPGRGPPRTDPRHQRCCMPGELWRHLERRRMRPAAAAGSQQREDKRPGPRRGPDEPRASHSEKRLAWDRSAQHCPHITDAQPDEILSARRRCLASDVDGSLCGPLRPGLAPGGCGQNLISVGLQRFRCGWDRWNGFQFSGKHKAGVTAVESSTCVGRDGDRARLAAAPILQHAPSRAGGGWLSVRDTGRWGASGCPPSGTVLEHRGASAAVPAHRVSPPLARASRAPTACGCRARPRRSW